MTKALGAARLRVLVLTNHFKDFCGSEVVALHTAQWFAGRGDVVTLSASWIGAPIMDRAPGIALDAAPENLDLSAYDLVWCQHDLLSLLPVESFERASRTNLPHIACVSLSPYEPYEHVNGVLANALSAEIFANSPETAAQLAARNRGMIARDKIRVFHNAAPAEFWRRDVNPARGALQSLLIISNHQPEELRECAALLESQGVAVRQRGLHDDFQLVTPDDIEAANAIVSIGKSVSYAIAAAKPVFIYDHFGGDGWLSAANFAENMQHNFSGRPNRRKLSARELTDEIVSGYAAAADAIVELGRTIDLSRFHLDAHLGPLRERALKGNADWPRRKLWLRLRDSNFRAHLAALRSKSQIAQFLRRHIEQNPPP